jgi:hypothetical protein
VGHGTNGGRVALADERAIGEGTVLEEDGSTGVGVASRALANAVTRRLPLTSTEGNGQADPPHGVVEPRRSNLRRSRRQQCGRRT